MKRLEPEIIDYYNTEVLKMILEKYGMTPGLYLKFGNVKKLQEIRENLYI